MHGKSYRVGLCVGPSYLWIGLWITVNPERLGGTQIPCDVGGEIW